MKKQNGITLVALIITIIVMVILAGVIIASAVADGGIIDRAESAMKEKERAEAEELVIASYVYKTTASTSTIAVLDLGATADAIYENLTTNGFTLMNGETIATSGSDILNGDEINLDIIGKEGNYTGTVTEKGLQDGLKIEDENNGGEVENNPEVTPEPTPEVTNTAYAIGDIVSIGTESFYVIEASDASTETLVLLAKDNIDIATYKQSSSASYVWFALEPYWSGEFTSSPYDLVESGEPSSEHYAAYHAYKYAKAIDEKASGRLMTYNEAKSLKDTNDTLKNMINGTESSKGYLDYWLGSADSRTSAMYVYGKNDGFDSNWFSFELNSYVRPVVTIIKSEFSGTITKNSVQ